MQRINVSIIFYISFLFNITFLDNYYVENTDYYSIRKQYVVNIRKTTNIQFIFMQYNNFNFNFRILTR
jgi:hypothetical protein